MGNIIKYSVSHIVSFHLEMRRATKEHSYQFKNSYEIIAHNYLPSFCLRNLHIYKTIYEINYKILTKKLVVTRGNYKLNS